MTTIGEWCPTAQRKAQSLYIRINSHTVSRRDLPRMRHGFDIAVTHVGLVGDKEAGQVSFGNFGMIYIFVNCNWVVTRWQKYSTHLQTNNTQNDTKQTIHRPTQQFWKSGGRAPSWLVIPWHLPYNRGKSTEKPQSGQPRLRIRR